MAILNNLIVNGTARFLNTVYADDVDISGDLAAATITSSGALKGASLYLNNTLAMDVNSSTLRINSASAFSNGINFGNSKIASSGTVNLTGTTTATTLNTTTIKNSGNIYNTNGRVETDEIRSNVWDIVSTQNLGGDFFVAPTIMVKDGSTFTITAVSGTTITGSITDTTNITSANFGGHTWSSGSKIKITGKLTNGSNTYILGVCDGTLSANMNATANTISFSITCNASTVPPTETYTISDGTVMMYNVGGSNKVGIYMTCYGTDKYTYIDVYDGSNGDKPVARLGKLNGLDAINGISPTDYGIYTTNGFYRGKIVANGGTIGGWTIGDAYLTTNTNRTTYDSASATGMTLTASGIGAYGSATKKFTLSIDGGLAATGADITGTLNATTGTFGNATNKITVGTGTSGHSAIRYGMTTLADTSHNGFYVGTDGIALGKGAFKVTAAGELTATSADITGTIKASSGYISGDVKIGGSSGTAASTVLTNVSTAQSTANDASYAVEIRVTNIDYATPTATLVATAYHLGAVVSSGITYTWYKNAVGTAHGGTASTNTLTVTDLNANYICVISSS